MGRASIKKNKNIYQLTRENLGYTREKAEEALVTVSAERIEKMISLGPIDAKNYQELSQE